MTTDRLPSAAVVVVAVALLGAVICVRRSRAQNPDEKRVWRLMFLGVAIVAGSALFAQGLALVPATVLHRLVVLRLLTDDRPDEVRHLIFNVGCVLGCAALYQALVHWNRLRTRASDSSEFLNGLSAVLVLAALTNVVLGLVHSGHRAQDGLAQWQLQAAILACSSAVIVLGTAASVSVIGGLIHDRRLWLISVALCFATGTEIVALISSDHASAGTITAWLLSGGLIAASTLIAPGTSIGTPHTTINQALTEDLRLAVKLPVSQDNQIVVYFQPHLNATTGLVVGAEVLTDGMPALSI